MGATLSNLQIIDAEEANLRDIFPTAPMGRWSERFVTVCISCSPTSLEQKAKSLSASLSCTVLSVFLHDSDAFALVLFVNGKRIALCRQDWENNIHSVQNLKGFCTTLKLSEMLAPLLKRLFENGGADDTLFILSHLLGAPLLTYQSIPFEPPEHIAQDESPLLTWLERHPTPYRASSPKIKNQCKAELLQEFIEHREQYDEKEPEPVRSFGGYFFELTPGGYEKDGLLRVMADGKRELWQLPISYMPDFAFTPDGSFLFCTEFFSGLQTVDLQHRTLFAELSCHGNFCSPIADHKNRLWVGNGNYFECYTSTLELISRHRLAGKIIKTSPSDNGDVCVVTHQYSKSLTRVYRFY